MFLSLSLSLFAFQTEHYTASRFDLDHTPADLVRTYECHESYVDNGWHAGVPRRYLNLWNEADNFNGDDGIRACCDDIPMQELFDRYYVGKFMFSGGAGDEKRGNHQVNFGFCSGRSQAKHTHANVSQHFGCQNPSVWTGSKDPLSLRTLVAMTKLGKRIGVPWMQEEYLARNPQDRQRLEDFAMTIDPSSLIELVSVAFTEIKEGCGVDIHVDTENCPKLPVAWTHAAVMVAPDGR